MSVTKSKGKLRKIKMVTVVGARPQFIKAAMVSRAIAQFNRENETTSINEIIVHTGQHYDYNLSQVFFDQLKIPLAKYHLEVGSDTHGKMTGNMLQKVETILMKENPQLVLVYGDTNSTIAGALAAAKLNIPVAHVEAGLRSYNRLMPEEVNRVMTDHISEFLFCPTDAAVSNLKTEGINKGVFKVGDVMYDAFLTFRHFAQKKTQLISKLKLNPRSFYLATIHRQENTDNLDKLTGIFKALDKLACDDCPVILPIHPRTEKVIQQKKRKFVTNHNVKLIPPVSYLEMVALEAGSKAILTDSGGMQKEAYFACVPCITLREETEWVETVDLGWNLLAGANTEAIIDAVKEATNNIPSTQPKFYGNGNASQKITHLLAQEY